MEAYIGRSSFLIIRTAVIVIPFSLCGQFLFVLLHRLGGELEFKEREHLAIGNVDVGRGILRLAIIFWFPLAPRG